MYLLLAGVVVVIHLLFVVYAVFGGLLVLRWPRSAWLHLPAAFWGAVVEFTGSICPLTPLENYLLRKGGEKGYGNDFIAHYLSPVLYPDLPLHAGPFLGSLVVVLNVAIYWFVIRRHNRE